MSIKGGNWQIFAHMLNASRATLHLSTKVSKVERLKDNTYLLSSSPTSAEDVPTVSHSSAIYDEIILAAPKQFSHVDFVPEPVHSPDTIPYVQLHVTLFTSKHPLSPAYFNLAPAEKVPRVVLTTLPEGERLGSDPNGVGSPGFFSISTLRPTMDTRDGRAQREFLYKVFSPEPVNDAFLADILGIREDEERSAVGEGDVSWAYRKVWHSYPYEYPRVTFEDVRLDKGLWYTSGIESFISTMETSSLMGMNVAKLIVDGWIGEHKDRGGYGREL